MKYQNLSKSQLITALIEIERACINSIQDANDASKKYSKDIQSQQPFEIGYLGGTIKTVLSILNNCK